MTIDRRSVSLRVLSPWPSPKSLQHSPQARLMCSCMARGLADGAGRKSRRAYVEWAAVSAPRPKLAWESASTCCRKTSRSIHSQRISSITSRRRSSTMLSWSDTVLGVRVSRAQQIRFPTASGTSSISTASSSRMAKAPSVYCLPMSWQPRKLVAEQGQGIFIPPPPPTAFGIPENHTSADWVKRRLTPHPVSTYDSPMRIDNPVANGRPRTYIQCTNPVYGPLEGTRQWVKKQENWNWQEIATAHAAMVTAPAELARMLAAIG